MSASRFYAALTALLFLAVSAWTGAALFGRLDEGTAGETAAAEAPGPSPAGGSLRGIVLRRELVLPPGAPPEGARDGERLSARQSGHGSGLYYAACDGYERLTPEDAAALTPDTLDALLRTEPGPTGAARLVTGRAFFYAAFYEGGTPPEAGDVLRLRFEGSDRAFAARVLRAADGTGRTALLLRLTEGEELLGRARFLTAVTDK